MLDYSFLECDCLGEREGYNHTPVNRGWNLKGLSIPLSISLEGETVRFGEWD